MKAGRGKRVFVGLSGGVDSAVSTALLQKEGYDVTGVFIRIALPGYPCSAGQDQLDAMRVAAHLRIPFLAIDLSEEYQKLVFKTSMAEFERGRTPNPDALCNREIKFGLFFDWCVEQGADLVATGHYAQLRKILPKKSPYPQSVPFGRPRLDFFQEDFTAPVELWVGADPDKDQSYFLWAVSETKLRRTLFPIGGLKKPEVRKLAKKFGLPNAARKDSQGLCFLGPVSLDDMLHRELLLVPGDVLNEEGEVIGRHEGVQAYTLGQRHGFELFAQGPNSSPHYVIAKDAEFNTITVSAERYPRGAMGTVIELAEENWIGEAPDGEYMARYRYRQTLIPAIKNGTEVTLLEPHFVPEGQSLVLYDLKKARLPAGRCVGGGVILTARHGDTHRKS